jgi:hypothetical protein
LPDNTIVVIALPEQIVWLAGVATALGVGFTNTVAVIGAPGQPLAVGVIVKVTNTGALVVLFNNPEMLLPLPLAGIPVTKTVLSLVQLKVVPETAPVNCIGIILVSEQIVCDDGVATAFGVGFTSTVAVIGVPGQPLAIGVIVNVTVIGALVVLVNDPLILPEPPFAIPVIVNVLSLDQLNTVPATLPLKAIVVMAEPEQMVCDTGAATAFGVGFTNTFAVIAAPGQPLAVGVIVNVTVIGALVVLVNDPLMLPLPLAAIPVTVPVLSLVQLKVVPLTFPLIAIVVIALPEQMVCDTGAATAFGVGFTSTVAVVEGPGQPLATGVIVKVTVTGAFVLLVNTPLMLPEPLFAIPVTVTVLSLVQLKVVAGTLPVSTIVVIALAEQIV